MIGLLLQGTAQDGDMETLAIAEWQLLLLTAEEAVPRHGGSCAGKAPNNDRDYAAVHHNYMLRYIWLQTSQDVALCCAVRGKAK